jgi:hypothetical protein
MLKNFALKNDENYEFFKFKTELYQTDKYKVTPDFSWIAVYKKDAEATTSNNFEESEKTEI